jgi:hypothetical protein
MANWMSFKTASLKLVVQMSLHKPTKLLYKIKAGHQSSLIFQNFHFKKMVSFPSDTTLVLSAHRNYPTNHEHHRHPTTQALSHGYGRMRRVYEQYLPA